MRISDWSSDVCSSDLKAHGGAGEMEPAQPLARQQRREDDDEQRPEVGDEAGIDRGRIAERDDVEEVEAEEAADAERPDRWRLGPGHDGAAPADRKADGAGTGGAARGRHRGRPT